MFSTPESGRISDTWTAVRILGGRDLDDAGRAFMNRYGLRRFPRLLAVTASGDLIDADLTDGGVPSGDALFAAMSEADRARRAWIKERDALRRAGDADSLRRLAALHLDRRNPAAAKVVLESLLSRDASVETWQTLLAVLQRLDDVAAERDALDEVIERFGQHTDRIDWRIRRATLHLGASSTDFEVERALRARVEALEALRLEVAAEGDRRAEARIRLDLAGMEARRGRHEEARAHVAWLLEEGGAAALEARVLLAEWALERGEAEDAAKHASQVVAQAGTQVASEGGTQVASEGGTTLEGREAVAVARAHMVLGTVAYGVNDLDALEEHFRAALRLAPDGPFAKTARQVLDSVERRRRHGAR